MATRRRFLKLATGGAGVYVTSKFGLWSRVMAQIPVRHAPPWRNPKIRDALAHSTGDAAGWEQPDH